MPPRPCVTRSVNCHARRPAATVTPNPDPASYHNACVYCYSEPPRAIPSSLRRQRNVIRFSSPYVAFSGAHSYVLMLPGMRFVLDLRAEPHARPVPDPFDDQ
jgi:hypothetical protein